MTQKYVAAAGAVDLLAGETVFPDLPASLPEAAPKGGGKRGWPQAPEHKSSAAPVTESVTGAASA